MADMKHANVEGIKAQIGDVAKHYIEQIDRHVLGLVNDLDEGAKGAASLPEKPSDLLVLAEVALSTKLEVCDTSDADVTRVDVNIQTQRGNLHVNMFSGLVAGKLRADTEYRCLFFIVPVGKKKEQ